MERLGGKTDPDVDRLFPDGLGDFGRVLLEGFGGEIDADGLVISPVMVPGLTATIRILVGLKSGTYTDRFGRVWQADRYYQNGSVVESMGHTIAGTREQRLLQPGGKALLLRHSAAVGIV